LALFSDLHIGAVIFISLDPAIDVKIHRGQKAIGFSFMEGFHPLGLVVVIEEKDLFADQRDGGLVELAVKGDGAVFGHPSPCVLAEIILKVRRRGSEAVHLSGEALKRALVGGAMFSLMVEIV
jgi:hypothetical protein